MDKSKIYNSFLKGIIFWGRLTLLGAAVLSTGPLIYMWFVHGIVPPSSAILGGFGIIASIIIVSWIVEPMAYFPILGLTGTYMAWLSGNISNLRVPVSAMAQEVVGVKEGTPEGDIVSTLGMGISVFVNIIILIIGVVIGVQAISNLPPTLSTALQYVLPAVFGAIFANFALRGIKLGIFSFAVALIFSILKLPMFIILPTCVFGTIALGIFMHNRENK